MARMTKDLQTLWWDWLSTAERLLSTLYEQTAALTLRDVSRIERLQPELDQMMSRMKEIDDRAAASAKRLAEELQCEPSLRGLVDALEKAEAQQVQALANRVIVAARNVEKVIEKNRKLLEGELEYVTGTLSLIARCSTEKKGPYSEKAKPANVLMNQVA